MLQHVTHVILRRFFLTKKQQTFYTPYCNYRIHRRPIQIEQTTTKSKKVAKMSYSQYLCVKFTFLSVLFQRFMQTRYIIHNVLHSPRCLPLFLSTRSFYTIVISPKIKVWNRSYFVCSFEMCTLYALVFFLFIHSLLKIESP